MDLRANIIPILFHVHAQWRYSYKFTLCQFNLCEWLRALLIELQFVFKLKNEFIFVLVEGVRHEILAHFLFS